MKLQNALLPPMALVLAAGLPACKKDKAESKDQAPAAAKVATESETPNEVVDERSISQVLKDCWASMNAHDKEASAKCYAEDASSEVFDQYPPMAATEGREATVEEQAVVWKGFPDMKSEPQLVLVNGNHAAALLLSTGTNSGEMMGMPATNKKISVFQAALIDFNDKKELQSVRHFMDQGTLAMQLGMFESPMAPSEETPWAESIWVEAKNDEAEKANLAIVDQMKKASDAGDHDGYLALVADDVTFRYVGDKNTVTGKEAFSKSYKEWAGMSEHEAEEVAKWAAGDWVVAAHQTTSTLNADMPGTKDTKGKKVTLTAIEFMQFADGKVKSHWVLENSMGYPVQLGLMPSEGAEGSEAKAE